MLIIIELMLTEKQAMEIYRAKLVLMETMQSAGSKKENPTISLSAHSAVLAELYGVTSRAIRDIWGRRSWQYATHHLWRQDKGKDLDQKSKTFKVFKNVTATLKYTKLVHAGDHGSDPEAAWTSEGIKRPAASAKKLRCSMQLSWITIYKFFSFVQL